MPNFEYTFVNPATGRTNRRARRAYDEEALREALAQEAIVPATVSLLAEEPATGPQLDYLAKLGIGIPGPLSKDEASALITNRLERREIAAPEDFVVAKELRVEVPRFCSKKELYARIFAAMQQRSVEDQSRWYLYRVYRNNFDRKAAGIGSPNDVQMRMLARQLAQGDEFCRSLRRVSAASQTHFRWFGKFRSPDGVEHLGDGVDSAAYRIAHDALTGAGLLAAQSVPGRDFRPEKGAIKRSVDLEGMLLWIGLIGIVVLFLFLWGLN